MISFCFPQIQQHASTIYCFSAFLIKHEKSHTVSTAFIINFQIDMTDAKAHLFKTMQVCQKGMHTHSSLMLKEGLCKKKVYRDLRVLKRRPSSCSRKSGSGVSPEPWHSRKMTGMDKASFLFGGILDPHNLTNCNIIARATNLFGGGFAC